jgi:4'-phosphopantetheinyl transferase
MSPRHRVEAADVFVVDLALPADRLARCDAVLDPAERARADRFLRPADRDRYRASHAALRLVLADALDVGPAEIRFAAGPAGKPALAGMVGEGLDFNLSHSGSRALVGLCRGAEIGVDVEVHRPLPDALRIARGHFAPDEAAALARLPPEAIEATFFGLWTRKEAVVKALGAGLSLPLSDFSVSLPPAAPRLLGTAGGTRAWTLADIDAGPGADATVAVRARAEIAVRRLPPDWTDPLPPNG